MKVGSYTLQEKLSETAKTSVYTAVRADIPDERFIIKCSNTAQDAENAELSLRNEYEISRQLLEPDQLSEYLLTDGQQYFVRHYFEGITLREWQRMCNPGLAETLNVCSLIAAKLGQMHSKYLIHKDLSPSNVLINTEKEQVYLIDFDLSSRLDQKSYFVDTTQRLEGTLPYMAPEQTGRMNRSVDYRADLYSLGAMMFELFTGMLPFASEDPLEIIHGHLSRKPEQLRNLNPGIPEVIDQIVHKLLDKNAEDRYQSAYSLANDLAECRSRLLGTGAIEAFPLAATDRPLHFQIPEKLYGRAPEMETLLQVFNKVAGGKKMLVSVGGYSGVGKSSLVNSLNIPITLKNGFFISGKFDLIQRNTPYLAWIQAFHKFAEILLAEDLPEIQRWKERISGAMGEATGVITALVPALEKIMGKQSLMEDLTANEDLNRFNYALRQFIKVISTPEHPLVIFLDDIQWADTASLSLLKTILTEPGIGNLLIIAAYRDNEVDVNHPYMVCVEDAYSEWLKVNETDTTTAYAADNELIKPVWVRNLDPDDLQELISDTFKGKHTDLNRLTELVHAKTQGNAFFVHQFLDSLNQDGYIRLVQNGNQLNWSFDYEAIERLDITENVIDLLNRQIERLPPAASELLKVASCLGYSFELHDLAAITRKSVKETEKLLFHALQASYIIPHDAGYRFVESYEYAAGRMVRFKFSHDRVAQTFYLALSPAEKERIHATAFEMFYPGMKQGEEPGEKVFEIAGHLQNSGERFAAREIRAEVFHAAGTKAKSSSAYALAYSYFNAVYSLYQQEEDWKNHYEYLLSLTIDTAQCAYLSRLYDETDRLINTLLEHAQNRKDYARGIEVLLEAYFVQQRFEEAVDLGIKTLKRFDFQVTKSPNQFNVITEFLKTNMLIGRFEPEKLLELPRLSDEDLVPIMRLMPLLLPSAFFYSTNLFVIIGLKLAVFTVRNGVSAYTTQSIANYSYMLCAIVGNYSKGIRYADSILALLRQKDLNRYKIRTKFSAYFFVEHYKTNVFNTLALLRETFKEGLENGDSDFTAFVGNAYVQNSFLTGSKLSELNVEIRRQLQYNLQVKNLTSKTFSDIYCQYAACLQGDAEQAHTLSGKYFNAETEVPNLLAINNKGGLNNYHFSQAFLKLLFGRFDEAVSEISAAERYKDLILGVPLGNYLPFMVALCHFARHLESPDPKTAGILRKRLKQISKLAKQCVDDFAHKALFTEAMLSAVLGKTGAALLQFQQALDATDPAINRFDKALCSFIYARYCARVGFRELAVLKLKESRSLFEWIQATAVVDYQNSLLEEMDANGSAGGLKDFSVSVSSSVTHDGIDLFSVIKSTHVISSEYELNELLKRMLPVIIENAGAQKGVILLIENNQMFVKASSDDQGEVVVYDELPVSQFDISLPILNFTSNTGESVILEHAHLSGRFVNDPYIVKNKVRSLLCMAISHKNKFTGLLYLENNLTSGAFNQNRTKVLNILATQASISIENATYFKHINQLNVAYERFVPKSFLSYLNKDSILNIRVGDQVKKEMAVMFADIRNFTSISENMGSEDVFDLLNEIWGLLNPVIARHGGIIDKYIGDSIMALFPDDKASAVLAAVEMQKLLQDFNALRRQQGLFQLRMGIGINAGILNLGTLGSDTRLNTTVIGDTVNVASRLEGLSKQLNVQILMTGNTLEKQSNPDALLYRNLGKLPLKGKERGVTILEEYSAQPESYRQSIARNIDLFNQIVTAFEKDDFQTCKTLIRSYQMLFPEDGVVNYLETRLPHTQRGN